MDPRKVAGVLTTVGALADGALVVAALRALALWCDSQGGHVDVSYDAHVGPGAWTVTLWGPRNARTDAKLVSGELEAVATATDAQLSGALGRVAQKMKIRLAPARS